jgi:hypothetical protein
MLRVPREGRRLQADPRKCDAFGKLNLSSRHLFNISNASGTAPPENDLKGPVPFIVKEVQKENLFRATILFGKPRVLLD